MTTETNTELGQVGERSPAVPSKSRRTLAAIVGFVFLAVMLGMPFLTAGRIDWPEAWVFLALMTVGASGSHFFVKARNPEVLLHRARIGMNTKPWDRLWIVSFRLMLIGMVVVANSATTFFYALIVTSDDRIRHQFR